MYGESFWSQIGDKMIKQARKENKMNEREILEESIVSHQTAIDTAKQKLNDLEVTYSIGDRFRDKGYGKYKYILAVLIGGQVGVVCLNSGDAFGIRTIEPKSRHKITQAELERIVSNPSAAFVRYWDVRKGRKV